MELDVEEIRVNSWKLIYSMKIKSYNINSSYYSRGERILFWDIFLILDTHINIITTKRTNYYIEFHKIMWKFTNPFDWISEKLRGRFGNISVRVRN